MFSNGTKLYNEMDNYFKTILFSYEVCRYYKYIPLKGKGFIELPKNFANFAKGLCKIKNDDDNCFKWCHIAFLFPVKNNITDVRSYIYHERDVDYTGITFPVILNQIM